MKKYILLLTIISILFGCGFSDIRKEGLARPGFEFQKTYIMEKFPIEIIPTYNVFTTKFAAFQDPRDEKEGTIYKAVKSGSMIENIFNVTDIKNKTKYIMKQENDSKDFDKIIYTISLDNKKFCRIEQKYKGNFLTFDVTYKDEKYKLSGKINKFNDIVYSFVFTIQKDEKNLGYIYKEFYYFKDEYEIILDRNKNPLDDLTYISFTVFADQILKENNHNYKD
jgi:hypothetical protein